MILQMQDMSKTLVRCRSIDNICKLVAAILSLSLQPHFDGLKNVCHALFWQ